MRSKFLATSPPRSMSRLDCSVPMQRVRRSTAMPLPAQSFAARAALAFATWTTATSNTLAMSATGSALRISCSTYAVAAELRWLATGMGLLGVRSLPVDELGLLCLQGRDGLLGLA